MGRIVIVYNSRFNRKTIIDFTSFPENIKEIKRILTNNEKGRKVIISNQPRVIQSPAAQTMLEKNPQMQHMELKSLEIVFDGKPTGSQNQISDSEYQISVEDEFGSATSEVSSVYGDEYRATIPGLTNQTIITGIWTFPAVFNSKGEQI